MNDSKFRKLLTDNNISINGSFAFYENGYSLVPGSKEKPDLLELHNIKYFLVLLYNYKYKGMKYCNDKFWIAFNFEDFWAVFPTIINTHYTR